MLPSVGDEAQQFVPPIFVQRLREDAESRTKQSKLDSECGEREDRKTNGRMRTARFAERHWCELPSVSFALYEPHPRNERITHAESLREA